MKPDISNLLFLLCVTISGLTVDPSSISAVEVSPKEYKICILYNVNVKPGGNLVATAKTTVDSAPSLREKRNGRQGRLIYDTLDDLNLSISLSAEDINMLRGLVDDMALLEPPKREYDIKGLLDWYYRYSEWNKEMAAECEDMLKNRRSYPGLSALYADIADNNRESKKELDDMVRGYQAELNNLFRIMDRRLFLIDRLNSLKARLSEFEEKSDRHHPQNSEKLQDEKKAKNIKVNIRVVQTELLSLVDIKEELLKHYVVMIEMARDQEFWLGLKQGEYLMLANLSETVGMSVSNDSTRLEEGYSGLIQGYENEIKRLDRKIDELDRKRSGVSQVGSYRDLDRSEELSDFYMDRRQRYSDYINRLKTRIGAAETELSQAVPDRWQTADQTTFLTSFHRNEVKQG
jgi:hypothetical protein